MKLDRALGYWDTNPETRKYYAKQFGLCYLVDILFMILTYGLATLRWKMYFAGKVFIVAPVAEYTAEHITFIIVGVASILCCIISAMKFMPTLRTKLITGFVNPLILFNLFQILVHAVSIMNMNA